jgi:hypothetical protein
MVWLFPGGWPPLFFAFIQGSDQFGDEIRELRRVKLGRYCLAEFPPIPSSIWYAIRSSILVHEYLR